MEDQELTKKVSNTSIALDLTELEITSQDSDVGKKLENEENSSQIVHELILNETLLSDQENENKEDSEEVAQKNSNTSETSSTSQSSSSSEEKPPTKRKRKRKRRRKTKPTAIAAYIPDEPFTKRYKKTFAELTMKPKLHVKFDESGNITSYQNNYKARIITALPKNLSITDNLRKGKIEEMEVCKEEVCDKLPEMTPTNSLKPRIIKAIGT